MSEGLVIGLNTTDDDSGVTEVAVIRQSPNVIGLPIPSVKHLNAFCHSIRRDTKTHAWSVDAKRASEVDGAIIVFCYQPRSKK